MTTILDFKQRQQALDITQSFIVQAPAGSGKTELLIQRYLTLLAHVENPEEIIAITFTRKAVTEMRSRITAALEAARCESVPKEAHAEQTWELARKVLAKDEQQQWQLLENPNRLRVQTIDSLCATLTRQMPLLARFGAQPEISEDVNTLYQQAVQNLLISLEDNVAWIAALEKLLIHLDNNHQRIKHLLCDMLRRRDQWLPHVLGSSTPQQLRQQLEQSLQNAIADGLEKIQYAFPIELADEIFSLTHFAASTLQAEMKATPIVACLELNSITTMTTEQWQGIANLLLTKDAEWRRTINKTQGFPAPSDKGLSREQKNSAASMKQRMLHLLEKLQQYDEFRLALNECLELPPPVYQDNQWEIVLALIEILPLLAAQLTLVFKAQGTVDFIEVANAALMALGDQDAPTDLALALDYQIKHILVDEFQDTSNTQYRLLEHLVSGWQTSEGRSLFLVGDPMQSIYRFREAEVGLFLRARQHGLAGIKLTSLILQTNFRSGDTLVHWYNTIFSQLFPKHEEISLGAVSYSASTAFHTSAVTGSHLHCLFNALDQDEAMQIIAIIQKIRSNDPKASIAILVKARSHITPILPYLRANNINYSAVEIEDLSTREVIQDLLALTRALLHPADRIAWLAILRAPWCGSTLADLQIIASDPKLTILDRIRDQTITLQLSMDGQQRLTKLNSIINNSLQQRRRQNLSDWIRATWLALDGPACVNNATELEDAKSYFNLLEKMDQGSDIADFALLHNKVMTLFAKPDVQADQNLQIMTIHKAKGLEFDYVIVPGLERRSPHDDHRLLMWMERPLNHTDDTDLLLAPIKALEQEKEPIYQYIRRQDKKKSYFEQMRLLYVATTRAKTELHLIATIETNTEGLKQPPFNSLLALLWDPLYSEINAAWQQTTDTTTATAMVETPIHYLKRLEKNRVSPSFDNIQYHSIHSKSVKTEQDEIPVQFQARVIGIVIHRILRQIALQGTAQWHAEKIRNSHTHWRIALLQLGMQESECLSAIDTIETAVLMTLRDTKGCWILQNHQDSQCEYPLTAVIDDVPLSLIIDRTFIDENNIRWIIDYKTAKPDNKESREQFLKQQQQQYRTQLQHYAKAMQLLENREIRVGLYFPLVSAWCEW